MGPEVYLQILAVIITIQKMFNISLFHSVISGFILTLNNKQFYT